MARGYIVEEVRVTGGSMRLRDSVTGDLVDVAITPGSPFMPPKSTERHSSPSATTRAPDSPTRPDSPEARTTSDITTTSDSPEARTSSPAATTPRPDPETATVARTDSAGPSTERPKKRRRKVQRRQTTSEPTTGPATETAATTVVIEDGDSGSRPVLLDESALSEEDKATFAALHKLFATAARKGKRGELGWQEITVDGHGGLLARWRKGQFKILHVGGGTYALFYEWDGGKFERIGCGSAEDLMHTAARRTEKPIEPPLTTLNLEFARLMCGTPAQKEQAREALKPVFDELAARRERRPQLPDITGLKLVVTKPGEAAPAPAANDTDVDPAMDDKIGGSLKKVLEDLD